MKKKSETNLTIGTVILFIIAIGFIAVVVYLLFINKTILHRLASLVGGII